MNEKAFVDPQLYRATNDVLPFAKPFHSCVTHSADVVYVVGVWIHKETNAVFPILTSYSIVTDAWNLLTFLSFNRLDAGCAVSTTPTTSGTLYAFGGWTEYNVSQTNTIEKYDINSGVASVVNAVLS